MKGSFSSTRTERSGLASSADGRGEARRARPRHDEVVGFGRIWCVGRILRPSRKRSRAQGCEKSGEEKGAAGGHGGKGMKRWEELTENFLPTVNGRSIEDRTERRRHVRQNRVDHRTDDKLRGIYGKARLNGRALRRNTIVPEPYSSNESPCVSGRSSCRSATAVTTALMILSFFVVTEISAQKD